MTERFYLVLPNVPVISLARSASHRTEAGPPYRVQPRPQQHHPGVLGSS